MSGKLHDLKILEEFFEEKLKGIKPFELRLDDRGFAVGDYLRLREIRPIRGSEPLIHEYTGRVIITEVLYIMRGVKGLQDGYVIMSERPKDILSDDFPKGGASVKCLICKYGFGIDQSVEEYQERTKDTCGVCKNGSRYDPKTEEDIVAEGVEVYEYKMGLPQYAAYKDSPKTAECLLKDCVREATFRTSINTTMLNSSRSKEASTDKAIPHFDNATVDECGVVKLNGKTLSTSLNGRGYLKVFLPAPDGKRKSQRVHRLVAEAFVPNPHGLPVVDHDDGNKLNNNASNLVWVTHQENSIKSLTQKVRERKPVARIGKGGKVLEVFLSISQAAKYKQCDYRGLYEAVKNNTKYKGDRWTHCKIDIKLEE